MLATRGGSIVLAIGAAIVAGILIFLFVQRYKDNTNSNNALSSVFVARSLIPKGSSGDVIASQDLLQRTPVKGSQVVSGALVDPATLHGEVATTDIYPGQQLTAADFTKSDQDVLTKLTRDQRAIAVPVDSAHGLIGEVHTGNYVDVVVALNGGSGSSAGVTRTLLQNVLVLNAPSGSGAGVGNSGNNAIVLRVTDQQVPSLAYAADNGKVWIVLRPSVGATQSTPTSVSLGTVGH